MTRERESLTSGRVSRTPYVSVRSDHRMDAFLLFGYMMSAHAPGRAAHTRTIKLKPGA